ncbi:MAG: plasmid stability protein [Bryobacteraceae bacterium]
MASITIRGLDDGVKARLRMRAASHGRSMEAEAQEILKAALGPGSAPQMNLAEWIRRHISPLGGVDLVLPARGPVRRPAEAWQVIFRGTNLLSEALLPAHYAVVMRWLASQERSSPTTTRVYDRRRRKVTRNIVGRISI